jgi:hypothetical protein
MDGRVKPGHDEFQFHNRRAGNRAAVAVALRRLNFSARNPVPRGPTRGTSFAIRAFDSGRQQEAPMRFSMNSYLLGVGTVVGALTFGFGGGILLTKTAIKDTPAGPSRVERAARVEPASPPVQVTETKALPVPRADPVPALQSPPEPAPQAQAAAENPKPVVEAPRENPVKVAEPVNQPDAPRQAEQPVRQSEAKPIEHTESEQRAAEREQRRAEQRRVDRDKRAAERERRARTVTIVRRQRPVEEQEQPARPELAFEREEPRPNLFEGLFGRPTGDGKE